MSIDDKIRQLWKDMDRVRACHPSRLPSWVTAAAIAAGLTLTTGACNREKTTDPSTDNPSQMGQANQDPGPAIALYAGPPPEPMAEVPMRDSEPEPVDDTPAGGNLYGGPPMDPRTGMDVPAVPAYEGPPMNERPVMNPPPIPPYGAVIPSPMEAGQAPETMEAPVMKTPMRRLNEPVTDYGAPFL